jgi:glycosyltransferase involved in cell wall biosynthesis
MSKELPLVSIAICTYNGERFLRKQLISILTQTYSNIEVVIVDDCSSDNTMEIVRDFKLKDNRLKYFVNDKNLGFNKNFEKAITLCTGDFIAISDQDDIWLSHKIERLMNCIDDKLMVYANSAIIDDNDELAGTTIINSSRDDSDYLNYKSILLQNFVSGHSLLFKKEALKFVLPFPKVGFYDWWMGFIMLYEHGLAYCNEVLTHYRMHEASVTNSMNLNIKPTRAEKQRGYCEHIVEELNNFQVYKGLKPQDSLFLNNLELAIQDKTSSYFSIELFSFFNKNSKDLDPGYKKGALKRIAYLYRNARGIKLFKLLSQLE